MQVEKTFIGDQKNLLVLKHLIVKLNNYYTICDLTIILINEKVTYKLL